MSANPLRSSSSIRASMDFSGPLNALSISPNRRLVAVGGRDVLRIMTINANGFSEKRNLRAGKSNLNFSTNDIRWHPQTDHLLATAATNGVIVIWNLQREGYKHVQERVLNGHRRAVNRICWHDTEDNVLLSGSQDGTIKLWDKRGKAGNVYQPRSESVRDVRFSPFQSNRFAAAFENGTVQVWDIRKNHQPEIKFTAHKGLVLAIDWHPTRANILASGGRDRYVKVWDVQYDVSSKQQQPQQTIQTIASVGRVAWRPNIKDQIATSASLMDNNIHVWDIQRPCIPLASMKGHSDIASGILWLDTPAMATESSQSEEYIGLEYWQHMLACSKDGTLKLHSLSDSVKPFETLPAVALSLNSLGQIAFSHASVDRSCASLAIREHEDIHHPMFHVRSSMRPEDSPTKSKTFTSDIVPMSHDSMANLVLRSSIGSVSNRAPKSNNALQRQIITASQSKLSRAASHTHLSSLGTSIPTFSLTRESTKTIEKMALEPDTHIQIASLGNVFSQSLLEKILCGDTIAYAYAERYLENLKKEFQNALFLVDTFGFDQVVFCFYAKHYRINSESQDFEELCAHNAMVALVAGEADISNMWRTVFLLYGDESQETVHPNDLHSVSQNSPMKGGNSQNELFTSTMEMVETLDAHHSLPLESASVKEKSSALSVYMDSQHNPTHILIEQLDQVNPQAVQGFDPYPCEHNTTSNYYTTENTMTAEIPSSPLLIHGNVIHGDIRRLRDQSMKDLLTYYVQRGELATCVSIAIIMNRRTCDHHIEKLMGSAWMQQMLMHYIEMLHQMCLYVVANEIISSSHDSAIRQMNTKSTSVYANCSHCQKPIESASFGLDHILSQTLYCTQCSQMPARCTVCQLPVRGLYVWCPVCSHGGHLEHMKEWFARESVCPAGCSHQCSYILE